MIYQVYQDFLESLKAESILSKQQPTTSLGDMFKDVVIHPKEELTKTEKAKLANRKKTPKRPLKKNKSPKEISKVIKDKVEANTNTPLEAMPETKPRFELFPEQKKDVDKAMKRFEKVGMILES